LVKSVRQNKELGSSTVCVLVLDSIKNELYSGYLGDSCYMIARPKAIGQFELIFKAEEQTHGFNIPFQVGSEGDNPNSAITHKHKVEKNDLIIAASDGLWDNLEVEDILKEINKISLQFDTIVLNTEYIAGTISMKAEELSRDPSHYSPFAKRAIENKYRNYFGGKPDDITVVVAQVLGDNKDRDIQKNNLSDLSLSRIKSREYNDNSSSCSTTSYAD
jgi:protein phosphatase PTC7